MRIRIRRELDADAPINLRRLSPTAKLYAGIMVKIHASKWYQSNKNKREEQEHAQQVLNDERLKDALLTTLYRELINNKTLSSRDDVCQEMIIAIDSSHAKSLERIINHRDFIIYDLYQVPENEDIRKAFPAMQILMHASKKAI